MISKFLKVLPLIAFALAVMLSFSFTSFYDNSSNKRVKGYITFVGPNPNEILNCIEVTHYCQFTGDRICTVGVDDRPVFAKSGGVLSCNILLYHRF